MFEFDEGTRSDPALASGFYTRSCEGNYAPGCNNLAWLYLRGAGVPQDQPHAMLLFMAAFDSAKLACMQGDASGCLLAGEMLYEEHARAEGRRARPWRSSSARATAASRAPATWPSPSSQRVESASIFMHAASMRMCRMCFVMFTDARPKPLSSTTQTTAVPSGSRGTGIVAPVATVAACPWPSPG